MSNQSIVFVSKFAHKLTELLPDRLEQFARVAESKGYGKPVMPDWRQHYGKDARAKYANYIGRLLKNGWPNIDFASLPWVEEIFTLSELDNANRRGAPLKKYACILASDEPMPEPAEPTPTKPEPPKTTKPEPAKSRDPANNLAQALQEVLANAVDEHKVKDIVQEALKDYSPKGDTVKVNTVRVEYTDNKPPKDLGLVHESFAELLKIVQVRVNGKTLPVWLTGPSGSGKTTAAFQLAKALGINCYHTGAIQNKYELLGFRDANGNVAATEFRKCYENGGVFLWDEVDASSPAALVAFNAALENGHCAFPDGTIKMHKDCVFLAAANTYGKGATMEYVGRNPIDGATIDRFVVLPWDYDEALERTLADNNEWVDYVQGVRKAVGQARIKHIVSPRASIRGAALLKAGLPKQYVINALVRKGLSDSDWNRVKGA